MIESTSEQWKRAWASRPAWTAMELAWLCCGWEPKSRIDLEATDRERIDAALDMILLAVRVNDPNLPIIEHLRWAAAPEEIFYREAPLFKPSAVWNWAKEHFPAFSFSQEDFDSKTNDEELDTRERTTLLTLIAALARHANVEIAQPAKAAEVIAEYVKELGVIISPRTINAHLKRIDEALDRRR
jgi:hypothetical protein